MPPSVVLTRSLIAGGSFSMNISQRKLPVAAKAPDSQKENPLVRAALKKRLPWKGCEDWFVLKWSRSYVKPVSRFDLIVSPEMWANSESAT
jgi:hypothetical protein